jgi:predicted transcriptional regulator
MRKTTALVTESDVLRCISDEKCRNMLTIIKEKKPLSLTDLELTRKQYYLRLCNIIECSLAQKKNGQYKLTSFGKVVFDWHLRLREIISNEYWKLAALDILSSSGVPKSDLMKVLNSLIQNEEVRQYLLPSIQK